MGKGIAIRWDDVDEDLSIEGLLKPIHLKPRFNKVNATKSLSINTTVSQL